MERTSETDTRVVKEAAIAGKSSAEGLRKTYLDVFKTLAAAIVFLTLVWHAVWSDGTVTTSSPSSVSAVSTPETQKRVTATEPVYLTIAPRGESERLPLPPGTFPRMDGSAPFWMHQVYDDGTPECITQTTCPPIKENTRTVEVYATNPDPKRKISVKVTFVEKN